MSQELPEVRVGVLGATGYIGAPYRAEMRACEGVRMVALCARRQDLLAAAAAEDGAELATPDWRAVVEHPDVNYVVVGTPDALHHEAVLAAAAAGKHLFCEKPVGLNAAEAREMRDAYQAAGNLAHFVPLWTRWSPAFVKAREIVRSGGIGEVKVVNYRWHNPRPPQMPLTWRDDPKLSSAGTIADVGSHAYDTVRWILGEECRRVLAHADTITPARFDIGDVNLTEALARGSAGLTAEARKGGTPDYAAIAWEFARGAVGSFVLSHAPYLRRGLVPELELHGTEASITVDRFHGKVTRGLPDNSVEVIHQFPPGGFDIGNRFKQWVIPALREVMRGARQEDVDVPNLHDGLEAQLFTDAVAESAKRGTWVEPRSPSPAENA